MGIFYIKILHSNTVLCLKIYYFQLFRSIALDVEISHRKFNTIIIIMYYAVILVL